MSLLINIFKPDPHVAEIEDPEEVKNLYSYWRRRILYSGFIGYALYYFTRKSFTFAMPGLIEDLHFDKGDLGLLGSILSITYGISKFASGILSDQSKPRYFMAAGLFLTGIFNILFGMSSSLFFFAVFWGLNGWFQGFGWPPCARFLMNWYSHSERGTWWSTWSLSHNLGAFLIPWIVGFCLQYFGWRYAMYIPGVICMLGSFFLLNRLRDTPESLGLPPIDKYRKDFYEASDQAQSLSTKEILVKYIFKNKWIWILAASYFFIYVVRTGVNDWTALYLIETKNYSEIVANGCVSIFEIGGILGTLAAGWASDYFFSARRGPVNVIFSLLMFLSLGIFWLLPSVHPLMDSIAMFFVGFAIFGPQMLIGVAAAELSHKQAAASANGFVGFVGYIGAAFAGYPLGILTDHFGWDGYFYGMTICCLVPVLLLLPLWNVDRNEEQLKLRTA